MLKAIIIPTLEMRKLRFGEGKETWTRFHSQYEHGNNRATFAEYLLSAKLVIYMNLFIPTTTCEIHGIFTILGLKKPAQK